ncbi:hypothetical protein BKA69DRAFT_1105666 [Paraphysoderma sedebokerense]|nr:hypothetical protein BKA69DRAFT_1105666 [Paraphysoderma sedebokerense]
MITPNNQATSKVLYALLRSLSTNSNTAKTNAQNQQPTATDLVTSTKLLLFQDNVNRIYPFWASRIVAKVSDRGTKYIDIEDESELVKVMAGLNERMLGLGGVLAIAAKTELKTLLEELPEKYKDYLPRPEVMTALCASSNVPDIEDWLKIFDTPFQLTLESELTWPAQSSFELLNYM